MACSLRLQNTPPISFTKSAHLPLSALSKISEKSLVSLQRALSLLSSRHTVTAPVPNY